MPTMYANNSPVCCSEPKEETITGKLDEIDKNVFEIRATLGDLLARTVGVEPSNGLDSCEPKMPLMARLSRIEEYAADCRHMAHRLLDIYGC